MNAATAGKIIAKYVNKSWPDDRKDLFELLEMAVNRAWSEGKWLGMTREFFVSTQKHADGSNYIIAPPLYPVLLAINVDGRPAAMRSQHFIFHKNGMGDIRNGHGCNWSQDVYDIGEVSTLDDGTLACPEGFMVGVRCLGNPGEDEKVFINGSYIDGTHAYSYRIQDAVRDPQCNACTIEASQIVTDAAIPIDIQKGFNYICNIRFGDVYSIHKTPSRCPVEILAIRPDNSAFVLARMEPGQTKSAYRRYLLPDFLCRPCVHGLFKVRKQPEIHSDTDEIIIDDKEVLISLAMGTYNLLSKQAPDIGAGYISNGVTLLEKQKRETESPEQFPIQMDSTIYADMPWALRDRS